LLNDDDEDRDNDDDEDNPNGDDEGGYTNNNIINKNIRKANKVGE